MKNDKVTTHKCFLVEEHLRKEENLTGCCIRYSIDNDKEMESVWQKHLLMQKKKFLGRFLYFTQYTGVFRYYLSKK